MSVTVMTSMDVYWSNYDSHLLHVMSFNWNFYCFCFTSLIILLSGDVHLNPGPEYPCGQCGLNVNDDDQALCCDSCDKWIHVSCDCSLTVNDYNKMLKDSSDDPWFCPVCRSAPQSQIPSQSGLSCVCFNARSIIAKHLDFLAYAYAHQFDVIAVTETFLDQSIPDVLICPNGYTIFKKDRNHHGGGILVLVKSSIVSFHPKDFESDCEMLWIELLTSRGKVNFVTFYHPPGSSVHDLQQFMSSISLAVTSHLPMIDFNVPDIDWNLTVPLTSTPVANLLCSFIQDNSLVQLVCHPT